MSPKDSACDGSQTLVVISRRRSHLAGYSLHHCGAVLSKHELLHMYDIAADGLATMNGIHRRIGRGGTGFETYAKSLVKRIGPLATNKSGMFGRQQLLLVLDSCRLAITVVRNHFRDSQWKTNNQSYDLPSPSRLYKCNGNEKIFLPFGPMYKLNRFGRRTLHWTLHPSANTRQRTTGP